jgi:hypothetical protein
MEIQMNTFLKRLPRALVCCTFLLILVLWQFPAARAQEPTVPANPTADETARAAWDALPVEIQAKVDPRILAELRGEDTPSLDPTARQGPRSSLPIVAPADKTRFLVHLKAQTDLDALEQRVYASAADRRAG